MTRVPSSVMAALLLSHLSRSCARTIITRAPAFAGPARPWKTLARHAHVLSPATEGNVPEYWKENQTEKKSDFITHFVAGTQPGLTVEDAVQSLLPKSSGDANLSEAAATRRRVILLQEDDLLLKEADAAFRHDTGSFPTSKENDPLSAVELLALGSIWYLPVSAPRDPALGGKPTRLHVPDASKVLVEGDYLRLHNPPRRFPAVNMFDWGKTINETKGTGGENRGVIVAQDDDVGYIIVDKPLGLPVHGTVDNILENVAAAVGRALLNKREAPLREMIDKRRKALTENTSFNNKRRRKMKQKKDPLIYISSPQRLDQNTSGLFVISTKKQFASYFAKLLRKKTNNQLLDYDRGECGVHKTYKCLVCVSQGRKDSDGTSYSVAEEISRLRKYAAEGNVIRHWLEPSVRAPKTFSVEQRNSTWAECLLRVKSVGDPYAIVGSDAADTLLNVLWENKASKPPECVAVIEVEIELLTGRTHQIRGQMSAEGFPLVGDVGYGGAVSMPDSCDSTDDTGIRMPEKLALQCCQLEFLEPDFVEKKGDVVGIRSDRWKSYRLEEAWWTPMLQKYASTHAGDSQATISRSDEEAIQRLKRVHVASQNADDQGTSVGTDAGVLPPRVQLSPGKNKYVIIKAMRRSSPPLRFVRSANPLECGGPYHADVARSVIDELASLGYESTVEGGGRIDYVYPHAHVYGFSYGFGKGDHELAAKIIEECSGEEIYATFDESDGIY
eukprot:CAMPEP_0178542494 /NCGR_PEP_ID=MMETSP0697-20121206/2090_1 /TAXON_ID=265572 /ORGANISM="Extubocellulus spinifer, Strain CCMP396" /LENGTH=728 /DNA_ID=CAMNT_0020174901 /DNA_START=2280 /DNA_END=4466 /DNA_ORIENTATION=+